jgi:hypothetical protein
MHPENKQRKAFEKRVTVSEKAQEASYSVAVLTVEKVISKTTVEIIMFRACKITARTVTGKEAESEIDKVPISDHNISSRVEVMSHEVEDVLCETLKSTNFAL